MRNHIRALLSLIIATALVAGVAGCRTWVVRCSGGGTEVAEAFVQHRERRAEELTRLGHEALLEHRWQEAASILHRAVLGQAGEEAEELHDLAVALRGVFRTEEPPPPWEHPEAGAMTDAERLARAELCAQAARANADRLRFRHAEAQAEIAVALDPGDEASARLLAKMRFLLDDPGDCPWSCSLAELERLRDAR